MGSTIDILMLTGHRKSGTTLLHKLFDSHPEALIYPVDPSLFYAYFPCFSHAADKSQEEKKDRINAILRKTLKFLDDHPAAPPRWRGVDAFCASFWKDIVDKPSDERGPVLEGLLNAWADVCDKSGFQGPFILKETSQAIFFSELSAYFPKIRFINIVRDPRDNYAAIRAGTKSYYSRFGEGDLEGLASLINRVRMDLLTAELLQNMHPDSFRAVRFEDLTTNTAETMSGLAEFSALGFSQTLLNPTLLGLDFTGNSHEEKIFSGVSSENTGRWRERISSDEAKVIEYWCNDVMNTWNYKQEFSREEAMSAFARFYEWYNCRYFFYDSFSKSEGAS